MNLNNLYRNRDGEDYARSPDMLGLGLLMLYAFVFGALVGGVIVAHWGAKLAAIGW